MNAVDTNVLIYGRDPRDPRKQQQAQRLLTTLREGVLPWQVACEYVAASRKLTEFGFSPVDAWSDLEELKLAWKTFIPSWDIHRIARDLMMAFGTSFWDALLVASCVEAGITRLYSEDFGSLQSLAGVEIVNPFRTGVLEP